MLTRKEATLATNSIEFEYPSDTVLTIEPWSATHPDIFTVNVHLGGARDVCVRRDYDLTRLSRWAFINQIVDDVTEQIVVKARIDMFYRGSRLLYDYQQNPKARKNIIYQVNRNKSPHHKDR